MSKRKRSDRRRAQNKAKTTRRRADKVIRIRGLTRQQHAFLREKILGMNDKDAALAAGYAPSVAENTKQKIWTPEVKAECSRLMEQFAEVWRRLLPELDAVRAKGSNQEPHELLAAASAQEEKCG